MWTLSNVDFKNREEFFTEKRVNRDSADGTASALFDEQWIHDRDINDLFMQSGGCRLMGMSGGLFIDCSTRHYGFSNRSGFAGVFESSYF